MLLKEYLPFQTGRLGNSKFNKNIELKRFFGSLYLNMGELTQSGEVIEEIWSKGFDDLLPPDFSPNSALILGFGAGSAAKLINRTWPDCAITGIEIDPVVIKVAREHFHVDQIPNLKLINADAHDFALRHDTPFDLVLVDCYLGDQFPAKLEEKKFLEKLAKLSNHVIINRLFWQDYIPATLAFHEKLKIDFTTTNTRTASNYLIHLSQ